VPRTGSKAQLGGTGDGQRRERAHHVGVADVEARFRTALARAAGGEHVVWDDGDAELLVRGDAARVRCADAALFVGLPVFTAQTGEAEVVLVFALGTGLQMAAERPPRGPATIVDRWGEALIAAVWDALVAMTLAVAPTNGDGRAVSLAASADGLTIDVAPQS
jgi:hypothetical protein